MLAEIQNLQLLEKAGSIYVDVLRCTSFRFFAYRPEEIVFVGWFDRDLRRRFDGTAAVVFESFPAGGCEGEGPGGTDDAGGEGLPDAESFGRDSAAECSRV